MNPQPMRDPVCCESLGLVIVHYNTLIARLCASRLGSARFQSPVLLHQPVVQQRCHPVAGDPWEELS